MNILVIGEPGVGSFMEEIRKIGGKLNNTLLIRNKRVRERIKKRFPNANIPRWKEYGSMKYGVILGFSGAEGENYAVDAVIRFRKDGSVESTIFEKEKV